LGDEVVDDALDVACEGRRLAGADRLDDLGRQAGFAGEAGVGIELVLRLEVPADQADRELAEVARQRVVEAAVFTELLRPVSELWPAQPRLKGPAQTAARAGDDGVGRLLLLGRELVEVERSQTRHGVSFVQVLS